MHLSALFIYPVKSLRGLSVQEASLDELGLVGDRRFMVVDDAGRFLTQRSVPRMALVNTGLGGGILALSSGGDTHVEVGLDPDPSAPLRTVEIWKSAGLQAEDCGAEAATWLSAFLGLSCHLVRIGKAFHRPLPEHRRPSSLPPGATPLVSFADAFPLLILSQASLDGLNARLLAKGDLGVPVDRFRTNLLVSGCDAHEEDRMPRFQIGRTLFHAGGPCARCVVTTTDQATAERSPEPLRTLAGYRRDSQKPSDVNFGQNLVHESPGGRLRVGDELIPLA